MVSKRLANLHPYTPGEQPKDSAYIKLNTNENPYPPAPAVADLLRTFDADRLRLYPDPTMEKLREHIGNTYGLEKEWVFVGNGSDEVLAFIFYAFFDSEYGPLLIPDISYSFYPVYCTLYGIEYRPIALAGDFTIDLQHYLDHSSCGVIFPNPNAPTGIVLELEAIEVFLSTFPGNNPVVIDEAYIDFGGRSAVSLLSSFPNLIITRSLSKSMALAGSRIGFALAHPESIRALFRVKDSFNSYPLDTITQEIGCAAMQQTDYYRDTLQKILDNRTFLSSELQNLQWEVLPSQANFLFAKHPHYNGKSVYEELKKRGILVRHFQSPRIEDYVRISIGTEEEIHSLLKTIQEWLS